MQVRQASPAELADWDAHAVDGPTGSVHQSRAWAANRQAFGWRPHFLLTDDGARVLALTRPWPLIRGDGAYVSRGPLPDADPFLTLVRLEAVTAWLAERGSAVVASDAEVPAESGYPELLAAAGYVRIEELQPSRHRLAVDLTGDGDPTDGADATGGDPAALLAGFGATTRNMIRAAERSDLRIIRVGPAVRSAVSPATDEAPTAVVPGGSPAGLDIVLSELDVLYESMRATADRRGFGLAGKPRFLDWSRRAFVDGHLVYFGAHEPGGELVAGATFLRHGRRWTYSNAADNGRFRKAYPGAVRLLVWEAIKGALAEGRAEMDLGGVDVPGARRRPEPGEPAYGMLTFKESFGARWIELSGAHQRVLSPIRYGLGRVTSRLAALTGRRG